MSYYTLIYPPKFVLLDCAIIYPFRYRLVARFCDVDLGTEFEYRGLVPSSHMGTSLNFGTQIHPSVVIVPRRLIIVNNGTATHISNMAEQDNIHRHHQVLKSFPFPTG